MSIFDCKRGFFCVLEWGFMRGLYGVLVILCEIFLKIWNSIYSLYNRSICFTAC